MDESEFIVVTTTSDKKETLEAISKELISRRLAACCQVSGPLVSFYEWNNVAESSEEWTCSIKTLRGNFDRIAKVILELHHYDQPQIVALPIVVAETGYADWLKTQSTLE